MLLIAQDWSKCTTWLNMPHQKLGNMQVILPNLWEPIAKKKKISEGEQTNTLNRFNFKNMFPEANNSPKAKTVSFEEQIIF